MKDFSPLWFTFGLTLLFISNGETKVLELSDRFIPLRHEGMWLIKFYAPWCGHCKKLEPIFKHVSQSLAHDPIRVARIDCTRFPSVAVEFGIRGYPTVMFLKGENTFTYEGDRTREDIVNFAKRLMGPPVKDLRSLEDLQRIIDERDVNFVFVGQTEGPLWDTFNHIASLYQQHEFFFNVPAHIADKISGEKETQVIRVFKDGASTKFEEPADLSERSSRDLPHEDSVPTEIPDNESPTIPGPTEPTSIVNSSLHSWVAQERFPLFVKITRGKFHHILSTQKLIVIAVLEQNKIGELSPEMEDFKEMVLNVIMRRKDKFQSKFQFGWTGSPEIANSVAMETLSIPNLLVVNSSSYQHYLPDDDPTKLTEEAIEIFLDGILDGGVPVYGGASYTVRLYRAYYEAKTSVIEMWKGNPALTAVLFGLPMGFFSLICYSICCADIMDAEEEDDEDEVLQHEKTE